MSMSQTSRRLWVLAFILIWGCPKRPTEPAAASEAVVIDHPFPEGPMVFGNIKVLLTSMGRFSDESEGFSRRVETGDDTVCVPLASVEKQACLDDPTEKWVGEDYRTNHLSDSVEYFLFVLDIPAMQLSITKPMFEGDVLDRKSDVPEYRDHKEVIALICEG